MLRVPGQITNLATALQNTTNIGTAQSGVTAAEYGDGYQHITVLTLNTTLPNIPGGASLGVGKKLYVFPAGAQAVTYTYMSVAITQTTGHINANTPDVGIGSVIASGVISVLTGTATFMDLLSHQTAANCTGTATVKALGPTTAPYITQVGGVKDVHFNAAAAWSASGDPGALLTGTVTLIWQTLA